MSAKTQFGPVRTESALCAYDLSGHECWVARGDDRAASQGTRPARSPASRLQKPFLDDHQILSSRTIMGLDTQLVDEGTYFIVEVDGRIAGCGGWSRRATLYGGDQSPGRSATLLDPATDAARVRAMYTHPQYTRRGGREAYPGALRGRGQGRKLRDDRALSLPHRQSFASFRRRSR